MRVRSRFAAGGMRFNKKPLNIQLFIILMKSRRQQNEDKPDVAEASQQTSPVSDINAAYKPR
jgi:hypothetical protein